MTRLTWPRKYFIVTKNVWETRRFWNMRISRGIAAADTARVLRFDRIHEARALDWQIPTLRLWPKFICRKQELLPCYRVLILPGLYVSLL